MQGLHGIASSFVDNPVISPPQRSSYLAVVMGTVQLWPNRSGDGGQKRKRIGGGQNCYFRPNASWLITCTECERQLGRAGSRNPAWPRRLHAWVCAGKKKKEKRKQLPLREERSRPLTFFVISQKYCNCASEQEVQWCSKILCGLFTFVTEVNTCLKYVILQFKGFDWTI